MTADLDVVTGAFSFTGKYIARRLIAEGRTVTTLTGHPHRRDPFRGRVRAAPFTFDDPAALAESLQGATVVYNTYWIRFPYGGETYEQAVANTFTLIRAAREAGVRRFVHISITNASEDSGFAYFRGKGRIERELRASGLSHAIIRPTVLFGLEGLLLNNIAWLLRRLPIFLVPGSGRYRLQPVFVEDVAELAVQAGAETDDTEVEAAGPELYTFEELVRLIATAVGSRARLVHVPPAAALAAAGLVGRLVGDVVLTRDELGGLMEELLVPPREGRGRTSFSEWVRANAPNVGVRYASEFAAHYR